MAGVREHGTDLYGVHGAGCDPVHYVLHGGVYSTVQYIIVQYSTVQYSVCAGGPDQHQLHHRAEGGTAGPQLDSGRDQPRGHARPRRGTVRRHGRPGRLRPRLHAARVPGN